MTSLKSKAKYLIESLEIIKKEQDKIVNGLTESGQGENGGPNFLEEKNNLFKNLIEKIETGASEANFMLALATHNDHMDAEKQKLLAKISMLTQENGWLRDELDATQQRLNDSQQSLKVSQQRVATMEVELEHLKFINEMKKYDTKEYQTVQCDPEVKMEDTENNLQKIALSLKYTPNSGKLQVIIIQTKNSDIEALQDPYVKITLMNQSTKRVTKRKTTFKKKTRDAFYNEAFTFTVPVGEIQNVSLMITVMLYSRFGSKPIGLVNLGCHSSGTELRHWSDMLANAKEITKWHTLMPCNEPIPATCHK